MTTYLVDTNVLLRWVQPAAPENPLAVAAIDALRAGGDVLVITPQNLVELWSVATRPASANGLGMTPAIADSMAQRVERLFPLVPDGPQIHHEWRRLVVAHAVQGRQVFDARLAAVMIVHGISHILTFNDADFRRYPQVTALNPGNVFPTTP